MDMDVTTAPSGDSPLALDDRAILEAIRRHAPDVVWVLDLDLKPVFVSDYALRRSGYSFEELRDLPHERQLTPASCERVREAMAHLMKPEHLGPGGLDVVLPLELELVARDGAVTPVEFQVSLVRDEAGAAVGICGIGRDVAAARRAVAELKASEERHALALAGANAGVWDIDLVTGAAYLSPGWYAVTGYTEGEVELTLPALVELIHPDDVGAVRARVASHLSDEQPLVRSEHRIRRPDGTWLWVLERGRVLRDQAGRPVRLVGSVVDVHRRRTREEVLRFGALHDPLTGLPNRTFFLDRLAHNLSLARREPGHRFAVLFLDLDGFKPVNDTYGHPAGDAVLRNVARVVTRCLRPMDTLARMGGDEFAVLLEGLSRRDHAATVARRVLKAIQQPVEVDGHVIEVSGSIGIAVRRRDSETGEDLLRHADAAMYVAKRQGKGQAVAWEEGLDHPLAREAVLVDEVVQALARQEFLLHYQPVVDLGQGSVVGVEALLRWQHPEKGLLRPASFLAAVEEAGQMESLGRWVLEAACRQLLEWDQAAGTPLSDLFMCVNVSTSQCRSGQLAADVAEVLRRTGLPAGRLRIDLREQVFQEAPATVLREVTALESLGVLLNLDDFGTTGMSASYLLRLPIHAVKIHGSHVVAAEEQRGEMLASLVQMAHETGHLVVAEGVESPFQLDRVREAGCQMAQGFLLGPPLARAELEAFLVRE